MVLLATAFLAAGLPACSDQDPTATVTSRTAAPTSSASAPPALDLPAPAAKLPAPAQLEPGPASVATGSATSASPPATPGPNPSATPAPSPLATPAPSPPAGVDRHSDPRSTDVVVNKRRPLVPLDYAPADLRLPAVPTATDSPLLRPDTADAVEEMVAAAAEDGVGLVLVSGYRSFATQGSTYAYWASEYGDPAAADAVSARPGFSEHQTGLAFDIGQADGTCTLRSCFAETAAAQWAAANAADFGVILRYPPGSSDITGFSSEPWHFRFVGVEVAQAMQSAGTQTLEEHFGLPSAPSY